MEIRRIKVFSFKKILEELKKIHWPSWRKKNTSGEKTVFHTSLGVILFICFFALFFMACSFLSAMLMNSWGA